MAMLVKNIYIFIVFFSFIKKCELGVRITLVGGLATVHKRFIGSTSFTFAEHQNEHCYNDKHKASNDRKRERFAEKKYAHAHSCHRFEYSKHSCHGAAYLL